MVRGGGVRRVSGGEKGQRKAKAGVEYGGGTWVMGREGGGRKEELGGGKLRVEKDGEEGEGEERREGERRGSQIRE